MENNWLRLTGTILTEPEFSHKSYGESFYRFTLGAARKSGCIDELQVLISKRLLGKDLPAKGGKASLWGQIRTYNEPAQGRSRLHITAFAREFQILAGDTEDQNQVFLSGFLCKPPIYRRSPMGREICDLLLAVNRMYGKSDYIPCIAWGRNAAYTAGLSVGSPLQAEGRIQSRTYIKKQESGLSEEKTAYEVSILKIEEQ